MAVTPADIQTLRQQTGVGLMDAKRALEAVGGDITKAVEHLRKSGQKIADKKSQREIKEGVIGSYVHANGKVAALIALGCETDFVARTDDFKKLAAEIAMHVAAMAPQYLTSDNVPADLIAAEEDIYRAQLKAEGKPEAMLEKILPGKLKKFYSDICLVNQPYVRDDSQTIQDLLTEATTKLGENIRIQSFTRVAL